MFTLAFAIAAATIGFSVADLALFRGLPVDDNSKVVSLLVSDTQGSNFRARVSAPDLLDYRARTTTLEHAALSLPLALAALRVIGSLSEEAIFRQMNIDAHELAFVAMLALVCPLMFSLAPIRARWC